ncbi:hypothetical protein L7F22_044862 [Adiantum nelumboides]|nr:hypothetical protein [Adiantum nelumboides]
MLQQGRYISSAFTLVVVTGLEALTLWALLVAVFKSPGHPAAGFEGEGHAFRGMEVDDEDEERGQSLGGKRQRHESRWMKRERKREARGLPSSSDDDEAGEEADVEGEEEEGANADEAPLLSSAAQRGSREGPAPFRYNHANTSVFGVDGGLSALIPGKPQAPSRTGRAQLDDVMHAVEEGHDQAQAGGDDVEEGSGLAYLGGLQVKNTGTRRWCKQCNVEKPDRAHHCSSCGVCVLRMDHHCPWLANRCVGLRNHKAFFLFLCYTALLCVFAFQDMARTIVHYVNEETNGFETSPVTWAILLFIGFIVSTDSDELTTQVADGRLLLPFSLEWHCFPLRATTCTSSSATAPRSSRWRAPDE